MAGSTPIYGFPYPESSDLVANYPALGQDLAEDIEGVISTLPSAGLSLITPTSVANSGGTATVTDGEITYTGVSSLSINGVFTSNYRNYLMQTDYVGSTIAAARFRMRLSGTDNTTSNYAFSSYQFTATGGVGVVLNGNNATSAMYNYINTTQCWHEFTILGPQLAQETWFTGSGDYSGGGNFFVYGAVHKVATAYDGISFILDSGNMTGKMRIYGFAN